MGEIVGAALVAHVPPIVWPDAERIELYRGVDTSLVAGLRRLRAERLDPLQPDTVIVFDTHWFTTVEHIVSAHDRRAGLFTSDELPRAMREVPYDMPGDPELAHAVAALAEGRDDTWILACDEPSLPVHYPTINLLGFLQGGERWLSVGPLREFRRHETADPANIATAEARAADEEVLARLLAGDHASVIDGWAAFRGVSPEGFFAHYLMMVGAIGGRSCVAAGEMYSDYESAGGTGQVRVWFDRPEPGWTSLM